MKIDKEKTKALLEQVERWLESSESEISMELTLLKTGSPDSFKVRFDENKIALLILMLEADERLYDVAYSALLKYFADMSDREREESIEEFANLCREAHSHMEAALSADKERSKSTLYN